MVSIIARHLKPRRHLLFIFFVMTQRPASADAFTDFFTKDVAGAFDSFGQDVKKGFETAGNFSAARFAHTKATRAIDYTFRKKALEIALVVATEVLNRSQQAATGTLVLAEETAKFGLTSAEKFLSDVVRAVSPTILQQSANTAKGALELVKQIGVGALQGTQWIVEQATTTIDINHVRYQGDLQRLKTGVLGDVLCEGSAFKQPFSVKFDLDPRDLKSIEGSIVKILKQFETLFNENVANPIKKAFAPLAKQVEQAEKALSIQVAPAAINQAIEAAKQAKNISQELAQKTKEGEDKLKAAEQLNAPPALTYEQQLIEKIYAGAKKPTAQTQKARRTYIKTLKSRLPTGAYADILEQRNKAFFEKH